MSPNLKVLLSQLQVQQRLTKQAQRNFTALARSEAELKQMIIDQCNEEHINIEKLNINEL